MSRIVILGATGMCGAMVHHLAQQAGHDVVGISRQSADFDAERPDNLAQLICPHQPDLVINAAGITRIDPASPGARRSMLRVNGVFPHVLADLSEKYALRSIHISSDGVFTGRSAPYSEADIPDANTSYGLSKRVGEPETGRVITLRTSFLGPELYKPRHLLEWLLAHDDEETITGYTDHIWQGITTEQLARWCLAHATPDAFDATFAKTWLLHLAPNAPIQKADLLEKCATAFGRTIRVTRDTSGAPVTRQLTSKWRDAWAPLDQDGDWNAVLSRLAETSRQFYQSRLKPNDRQYA